MQKVESVSRNAPRPPITTSEATIILNKIEAMTNNYLDLVTNYDIRIPEIASYFSEVNLLNNNRDVQDMLDRANNLIDRVENSYGNSAARTRDIQEEYDRLVRMHARTSQGLGNLREQLERDFMPRPRKLEDHSDRTIRQQLHTSSNHEKIQSDRPKRPSRPIPATQTEEIVNLEDENRALRQQNSDLAKELEEARTIIRSLEARLGDRGDGRGSKRRRY